MFDWRYAVAGALTGFLAGGTGVGGGALMTPILLLFFNVPPMTAIATDLWFAALTKMLGGLVHHRSGAVDWQVARRLWWGSLPVALMTVCVVAFGPPLQKFDGLTTAVGVVVILTAFGLALAPILRRMAATRRIEAPLRFKAFQPPLTIAAGALLGLCVALTSVGAGALGSVILLYLYPFRMTPHRLVATDIVHAIPLAMVAGAGYLAAGLVDGWMLLSMLAGSLPAVLLGSLLATHCRAEWVRWALAAVLLAAGVKVVV